MFLHHSVFQARLGSFIFKVCAFLFCSSQVSSCLWLVVSFLAVGQYLVSLEIRKLNLACFNIYSNGSANTTHPQNHHSS